MKIAGLAVVLVPLAMSLACGGGMGSGGANLTVSLANSSAQVYQGQASVTVNVNLTRTGTTGDVTLSVSGLPQGASDTVQSPGSGNSGSVTLNAGEAAPGNSSVTIIASDGAVSGQASLSLTVGAAATISSSTNGPFSVAMSTSSQPAEWDNTFFQINPGATTTLANLGPHHIRLQGFSEGVPQGSAGTNSTAWNFSILDSIVQPVFSIGDHSPEFQIAKGPPFIYQGNNYNNTFLDPTFAQFAGYTQSLVQYYNTGGFTANGQQYVSAAYPADKITWWGIYNEPNLNNSLSPQQYTDLYNAVVPAMQAVDPTIKLAALELADFSGQAQAWVPTFVSGVTAQVDVMATHFYSTCNQSDTDATVMATVPGFATEVQSFYTLMQANQALASVPVWVTENNVNADFSNANGMSTCNPNQVFVDDHRGSSPFFAAWRPYVFSQLGKAGIQALYHWDFGADKQYGEVDYSTDNLQLSYWVDYWLGQQFPPSAGSQLLQYSATDDAELETLPVINADGSVVVMVANHTVNASTDDNGPGSPRSVLVDVSALGTFASASLVTIDQNTNVSSGPLQTSVTPAPQMPVTLNGYAVAFLTLKP